MKRILIFSIFSLLSTALLLAQTPKPMTNGYRLIKGGVMKNTDPPLQMPSYYFSVKPVNNKLYREFLADLKAENRLDELKTATPSVWGWAALKKKDADDYMAQDDLPIVNITREASLLFCQWLSKKQSQKDSHFTYEYRVPTLREMQYFLSNLPEKEAKTFSLFSIRFADIGSNDGGLNMPLHPVLSISKK